MEAIPSPADVLLVSPPSRTHYSVPPLGLGYLASALRQRGYAVAILDARKAGLSLRGCQAQLAQVSPQLIGFQVFSFDVPAVARLAAAARRLHPRATIICGGAHPSGVLADSFAHIPAADFAFRGEAEVGLPLLADRLLGGSSLPLADIPGLIWRRAGEVQVNPPSWVDDLDSLGLPAWDLLDPRAYPPEPQGAFFRRFPVAPLLTSRGCPYHCTYCAGHTISGRRLRLRTIPHVMEEISLLYHHYGVREIHIIDDTFTAREDRVLEFCRQLRARKLEVALAFPNGVRVDTLTRESLLALKEAGLYALTLGLESGSQRILDHMQKRLNLETIRDRSLLAREVGLEVNAFFILGYPAEAEQDIQATIRLARELPLRRAHFSNYLPLPGSEMAQLLQAQGALPRLRWEELFYAKVPYSPPGISKPRLKRLQRTAFLSFYLRPRILLGLLAEIRSLGHLRRLLRRVLDYLLAR